MSDSKNFNEMNEQELDQVSGGMTHDATFRCPVCGKQILVLVTNCEIGGEGPLCAYCNLRGQRVKMIRIA